MTDSIHVVRVSADATFWSQAAVHVMAFAQAQGSPQHHLRALLGVVPGGPHATALRAALQAHVGGALLPPRLTVWGELATDGAGGMTRRAQLFEVLRANPWIRSHFGEQPQALWALAQQVERLADELTYAAVSGNAGHTDVMRDSIEVALRRHYRHRAARALMPQARLVLDIWRAGGDALASDRIAALNHLADQATAPLVFIAGVHNEPWVHRWLRRYAAQAPVLLIEPDVAGVVSRAPYLAAAWPELTGDAAYAPIAARADALRTAGAPQRLPLTVLCANALEEEASAIAQQVLDALRGGATSVALVPLDRLTARRVRALLERAQVQVRDETGWKLSTTSAAAALMRWFDLVADDFYWRDVLDWLKSIFTLADRPHKAEEITQIEQAIRAGGAVQGARAIRAALDAVACAPGAESARAGAREVLALLHAQAQTATRAGPTLGAHLRALQAALDALGMRSALAADPVGSAVLREIDALEGELGAASARASLAEFRALLAARFEEVPFVDPHVQSPVVMVSLAATELRAFDVAILIGADASRLPSLGEPTLFMSNAVRAELGLSTADEALRVQAQQLALLLHHVPQVVATWRVHRDGEPNALSPLLERLQFVVQRAGEVDLCRIEPRPPFAVNAVAQTRPAPTAGALLPERLSASQAQSLVNCPYQFYARRLLGLAELEDLIEMPDKRDFGEALHEVLRRFHSAWGDAPFHERAVDEIAASLREHARSVFEPQLERAPGLLSFARRFDGLVQGYVAWLQKHCLDGWRWHAGEQKHTHLVSLSAAHTMELGGRIDRIDVHIDGRVQVIDYKARAAATLKQGLKPAGEDIQLPFYGALLPERAQCSAYLSFERAKDDESGIKEVAPEQSFEPLTEAVLTRLQRDLQRIADGAPLPAMGAEPVCAVCEMRGLCRRDYWEGEEGECEIEQGAQSLTPTPLPGGEGLLTSLSPRERDRG